MTDSVRKKILGCYLGKAVGGTLGAPWEGCNGLLNLTYYDPVPSDMLPNDDVDLQVVWGSHLATDWNGIVAGNNFMQSWKNDIGFPYDEYGVAIRNIKRGIPYPWTGKIDNWFKDGLGAAIRAEIWACLFPGEPNKAAACAEIDAALDHCGDGMYAEIFLSALESMAFKESEIHLLIERALAYIPDGSRLKSAIRATVLFCSETKDVEAIYSKIMEKYGSGNFTDVCMNLPFMIAGLLLGDGDFGKTICTAVNFGQDTDCIGATVGAVLGILNPDGIDDRWMKPIGHKLVLSKEITGINPPATIDEFADLLCGLRKKISIRDDSVADFCVKHLEIPCRQGLFGPWFTHDYRKFSPVISENAEHIQLPGNIFTVNTQSIPLNHLLMTEIKFNVPAGAAYKILVSTRAEMRAWVDGMFLFGQSSGSMLPAFHRAPINQMTTLSLKTGMHRLLIGIGPRPGYSGEEQVFFGIAGLDNQWVVC